MSLIESIKELVIKGWKFWNEENRLCYDAPLGESTSEVLAQLKQHKASIIRLLHEKPDIFNIYSLSHGQKALWFIWQLKPESAAYNQVSSLHIYDSLDIEKMRLAISKLLKRHPQLRSTFPKLSGQPIQQIHQNIQIDWKQIDAHSWDETEIHTRVLAESKCPFDLENEPGFRFRIFTTAQH